MTERQHFEIMKEFSRRATEYGERESKNGISLKERLALAKKKDLCIAISMRHELEYVKTAFPEVYRDIIREGIGS